MTAAELGAVAAVVTPYHGWANLGVLVTLGEIRERGWSRSMLRNVLTLADYPYVRELGHCAKGSPGRYYRLADIEQLEKQPEVRARLAEVSFKQHEMQHSGRPEGMSANKWNTLKYRKNMAARQRAVAEAAPAPTATAPPPTPSLRTLAGIMSSKPERGGPLYTGGGR